MSSATFITQPKGISFDDFAPDDYAGELEALVSGVSQTSQSTLLLKKRKEMREVDDALDFMKEEFKARMETCDQRQRQFEAKQKEMKDSVYKFEKFIQENDAKRKRADIKCKAEQKQRELLEEKLSDKRTVMRSAEEDMVRKRKEVSKHLIYQRYLEAVTEVSDGEYMEISELLNRHKTLGEAYKDVKQQVDAGEMDMDKYRAENTMLTRNTQNLVLLNNNNIHKKQNELEKLRLSKQAFMDEEEDKNIQRSHSKSELGQVIMSIKNLCVWVQRRARPAV